jgi:hypothetical protein
MARDPTRSRRSVLKGLGAGFGALAWMTGRSVAASTWVEGNTPTTRTLYDVTYALDGAYAVGGGGVLIEREAAAQWSTVFEDGPGGNGNDLYGAGVTDDGDRVWFVGASGAVGEYDVTSGLLVDHGATSDQSAPSDNTGNFRDVVATGRGGDANVYIADESGQIFYSFDNGDTWDSVTPGSGSTIPALDFYDDTDGHAADTNQSAFETHDGETWSTIGIEDRDENFYGVDSNGDDNVWICGGDGKVFEYDGDWQAETLGDLRLRDIEVATDRTGGLTVGAGGRVFRLSGAWAEEDTPTDDHLHGVVRSTPDALDPSLVASDAPDIAVGAAGTAIEH